MKSEPVIDALIVRSQKIEAIRLQWETSGCGLADAKEFVEAAHAVLART